MESKCHFQILFYPENKYIFIDIDVANHRQFPAHLVTGRLRVAADTSPGAPLSSRRHYTITAKYR